MPMPQFQWTWNLNTIVVLIGFGSGLIAWGYTIAEVKQGLTQTSRSIDDIRDRLKLVEADVRQLDNHELRIIQLEKQALDAVSFAKETQAIINALASDIRIVREVVLRMEASTQRHDTGR